MSIPLPRVGLGAAERHVSPASTVGAGTSGWTSARGC